MPPATDPETEFARELETFGDDVDVAIQCFYVWLTVHAVARKSQKLYYLLNRDTGFWNVAIDCVSVSSTVPTRRSQPLTLPSC